MAIDEDINSSPDFNSYSPEQLAELQQSALGESMREVSTSTDLFVITMIVLIFLMAVIIAFFILTKNQK